MLEQLNNLLKVHLHHIFKRFFVGVGVGCCARSLLLHAGFSQLQALGLLFMAVGFSLRWLFSLQSKRFQACRLQ